jgi:ribonuclease P protein component
MPTERDYPRLGIVVSKKTARRAVARNYMRRVIREWFRHHREQMTGHDLVIRVNKPYGRADFAQVHAELVRLLEKMKQRYGRQQENNRDSAADLAG